MSPFLEVVTRTFAGRRPDLLLRCHRSLLQLEDGGWTHSVIVDTAAAGVAAANRRLASFEAKGDWVWVLDDDDVCCCPRLVELVLWMAETRYPDAIVVKNRWSNGLVLPPDDIWGKGPVLGKIGTSCIITRGDVWNEYRDGWTEVYAGDFDYIKGLFDAGLEIAWLDEVVAEIPAINLGRSGG